MKNSEHIADLLDKGYTVHSELSTREGAVEFTDPPDVYIRTKRGLIVYSVDIKGVTITQNDKKKTAIVK